MQLLTSALPSAAFCVLYGLALLGGGVFLLRVFHVDRAATSRLLLVTTAIALGSGFYGQAWLLVALPGAFTSVAIWIGIAAGLTGLALLPRYLAPVDSPRAATPPAGGRVHQLLWWSVVGLTGLVVLLLGLLTMHAPMGDAVALYLAWPKAIAASGVIEPFPHYEDFSTVWVLGEMHLATMLALSGEGAAKMVPYLHFVATAALMWAMGAEVGLGRRGRLITIAALVTSSAVTYLVWDGKTDLIALLPGLAGAAWLLRLQPTRIVRGAALAGLLVGLSITAKLTYLPVLGAMVATILAGHLLTWARTTGWRGAIGAVLRGGTVITIMVLVALVPQGIKNAWMFGEPFAPIFHLRMEPLELAEWFSTATTTRLLLSYPLAMTYGMYWGQYGNLSVILLGFLVFARCRPAGTLRAGRSLVLVGIAALVAVAAWTVLRPSWFAPRYFLAPLLLVLFPVAFWGERASYSRNGVIAIAVPVFIAVTLLATVATQVEPLRRASRYVAHGGAWDPGGLGPWPPAEIVNEVAAPGERLAWMDWYCYPLRSDLLQTRLRMSELESESIETPAQAWTLAYRRGVRFLLLAKNVPHFQDFAEACRLDPLQTPEWLDIVILHDDATHVLYRLDGAPSAPSPLVRVVEGPRRGAWSVESMESDR